jgi:NAD(P)-dependent dehydrogenase (short-subunit alcohol dehydrogenase family)
MFMSVFARECEVPAYAELAGVRVLVTGVNSAVGVDVARSFADHKARLVLQTSENSPAMTELAAVLSESAAELKVYDEPFAGSDEAVCLVQSVMQDMGGLDAVVNLVHIEPQDCALFESVDDVEGFIADRLEAAAMITRVAANRMRLTWTEGAILNVVTMPSAGVRRAGLLADITRVMLADLTRAQAREWAEYGIRVNSVGPSSSVSALSSGAPLTSDADLAALALHLASRGGRKLTGHMLDAEGLATRHC